MPKRNRRWNINALRNYDDASHRRSGHGWSPGFRGWLQVWAALLCCSLDRLLQCHQLLLQPIIFYFPPTTSSQSRHCVRGRLLLPSTESAARSDPTWVPSFPWVLSESEPGRARERGRCQWDPSDRQAWEQLMWAPSLLRPQKEMVISLKFLSLSTLLIILTRAMSGFDVGRIQVTVIVIETLWHPAKSEPKSDYWVWTQDRFCRLPPFTTSEIDHEGDFWGSSTW